jgi:RpiR family carbohydrate utilization transcriptional regulator
LTSIIQLIRRSHATLRKSERKVADYVLGHADDVIHMRIVDLAQEAHVSEPTVVRFCRAIGYNSFQSFKLALAQYVAHHPREAAVLPTSPFPAIDEAVASIDQWRHRLDTEQLGRAAALMAGARRIVIASSDAETVAAAAHLQRGLWERGSAALLVSTSHSPVLGQSDLMVRFEDGGVANETGAQGKLLLREGATIAAELPVEGAVTALLLVKLLLAAIPAVEW